MNPVDRGGHVWTIPDPHTGVDRGWGATHNCAYRGGQGTGMGATGQPAGTWADNTRPSVPQGTGGGQRTDKWGDEPEGPQETWGTISNRAHRGGQRGDLTQLRVLWWTGGTGDLRDINSQPR